jgi:HK97 gp10 family phage protein
MAITGPPILGVRACREAFQQLPEITREAMNDATLWAVQQGARLAQAQIERSPSIVTRALHDHIAFAINRKAGRGSFGVTPGSTTFQIAGRRVRVKGLVTAGAGGSASRSAGARVDKPSRRAHFVEFGTTHQRAEPFMTPAAEALRDPYLDRCIRAGTTIERDMAAVGSRTL